MSRVDFYHLQKFTIDDVLPKLLEKAYKTEKNIIVKIGNDERVDFINNILWTYDETSFLPHGSKKDGNAENQPIWLTSGNDNPNDASLLFLVDEADINIDNINKFERLFYIFDGNTETALQKARDFWRQLKNTESECFYWQQDESGSWKQKA